MLRSGLVLLLTLLASPTLLSQMLPVFGPKQFSRDAGNPKTVIDSFQNCEPAAQYQVVVSNGDSDGNNRVSSASIVLNGTEIVGPQDFSQNVGRIVKPIVLATSNTLETTLRSAPGSLLNVDIDCISECLDVMITAPANATNIPLSLINILGTVSSSADEVGVAVNGLPAFVAGHQFAVPDFGLRLANNQLTATATNSCGNKATSTIQISVPTLANPPVTLMAAPSSGIASTIVTFTADISVMNPVSQYQWNFGEDALIDASGPNLFQVTHTYNQPGLFVASVVVTDSQGQEVKQERPILVFSRDDINAILSTRWQGLKSALTAQDIEGALQFFYPGTTDKFRSIFAQLNTELPQIGTSLGDVGLFSLSGGVAELLTVVPQSGDETFVHFIYAMQDQDGLWKFVAM